MKRILYLDCLSGISGDMFLGALLDLGLPEDCLKKELSKLGYDAEFHLHIRREQRQFISGIKLDVHASHTHAHEHEHTHQHSHEHTHSHEHEHGHIHGRSFSEIREQIEKSTLSEKVKKHAIRMFHRIAVAEGKIHGQPPETVTFHEVGAIDSIVDIVGAAIGIEWLAIDSLHCSTLFEGSGFIHCAHGRFPLPAPATQEILTGIPLRQIEEPFEFVTPTGAAIVAEYATTFGPQPEMRTLKIGYGLGSRELSSRPNILRAILAEAEDNSPANQIIEIQCNLDDTTPEILATVIDRTLAEGVLDAFVSPVTMKKNRPGFLLTLLCLPKDLEKFTHLILRETTAFGLRFQTKQRHTLQRHTERVATPYGEIEIKIGSLGDEVLQRSPELESCRAAAEKHQIPIRKIYLAAQVAAENKKA
ncbi:MAG: nickel pincer cofactor biosynthesis protein LarC [Chthoniobacterales bacterium]